MLLKSLVKNMAMDRARKRSDEVSVKPFVSGSEKNPATNNSKSSLMESICYK